MRYDVILAGVGGQGVLSVAGLIAAGALKGGWNVKQSEVHGMAQRGGTVLAHLRMGDGPVHSDLVPLGAADLILGLEPVEALRHIAYLSRAGTFVVSTAAVRNMPGYPDLDLLLERVRQVPRSFLLDAEALARAAGTPRSANVVLVGAASNHLPIFPGRLEDAVRETFAPRGEEVVEANLRAFRLGREGVRAPAPSSLPSAVAQR